MKYSCSHEPNIPASFMVGVAKGDRIIYRSGIGGLYSARVMTRHRNGEITIKVMFPLRQDRTEMNCGFVGARYRIGANNYAGKM